MQTAQLKLVLCLSLVVIGNAAFLGNAEKTSEKKVTHINLTEYNGHFEAKETLADMKPGTYIFHVTNKAGKPVGFQIQDAKTKETLAKGMVKQNKTKEFKVEVGENGIRYRCPVNPTPWYEMSVSK